MKKESKYTIGLFEYFWTNIPELIAIGVIVWTFMAAAGSI